MSLDATRWAWQQDLRPSHKLILLSLADRSGETFECYPSIARLQSDTGLYRETIMEAISHLETLGIISVSRINGKGNRYQLIGVQGRNENVNQSAKPVGKTRLEKPVGKSRHDQSGKADMTSREKPTLNLPMNLPMNLPRTESVAFAHVPGLNSEVWIRWEKYRVEIRKPIKPASILAAKKKMAGYGADQSAVVEQSIANGWQGLFSLKELPTKQQEAKRDWI